MSFDPNTLIPNGASRYGAQMGRRDMVEDDQTDAKVHLFRCRMTDYGAYDVGGAYWGSGNNPLYAAIARDGGFMAFRRGTSREDVKQQLLDKYPNIRFYR